MKTAKIRKGAYQVKINSETYLIEKNWHEDNKSWYVYDNEGDFWFDCKTKAMCLRVLNQAINNK